MTFPPESMESRFPSEIRFASLLVYSPRGSSNLSELSRTRVRDAVKRGDPRALLLAARRVVERTTQFPRYFDDDVLLVPVPRHAPTRDSDFWPTKMIGESFVDEGLAISCEPAQDGSSSSPFDRARTDDPRSREDRRA